MSSGSLLGQMFSMPPVTRWLALSIAVTTLLVYTDMVSPYSLFYSPLFLRKLEVWRVVTSFLYFGKPTLDVFMHIVFLYRYSRMLEEGCINTSEYFWLVIVVCSILFGISNLYGIPTLAAAFSATITYIWTKRNPRAIVQIFGFISFPAFYLPFILPGFMLLTRRSISLDDILGIGVGHLFYYFKDVYPRWGRAVLATPCWIKRLFGEHPADCCSASKNASKGITIGEGRARHERNMSQSSIANSQCEDTMVEHNETSVGESIIADSTVQSAIPDMETSFLANGSETMQSLVENTPIEPTNASGMDLSSQDVKSDNEWTGEWGAESDTSQQSQ